MSDLLYTNLCGKASKKLTNEKTFTINENKNRSVLEYDNVQYI